MKIRYSVNSFHIYIVALPTTEYRISSTPLNSLNLSVGLLIEIIQKVTRTILSGFSWLWLVIKDFLTKSSWVAAIKKLSNHRPISYSSSKTTKMAFVLEKWMLAQHGEWIFLNIKQIFTYSVLIFSDSLFSPDIWTNSEIFHNYFNSKYIRLRNFLLKSFN